MVKGMTQSKTDKEYQWVIAIKNDSHSYFVFKQSREFFYKKKILT